MGDRVRRGRAALGAIGAGTMLLALVGCGAPPWAQGGGQTTPSSSPTVSASTTPVPAPVPNDLSSGSTEKKVTAGAIAATVKYWSTLSMDRWTATALKPVSISMDTTVTPNDGQQVYLQRATMTAVPGNATQSFAPLTPQVAVIWVLVGPMVQSSILWIGWPIVGVVTVLQTLLMFSKLVRRHHGYKV